MIKKVLITGASGFVGSYISSDLSCNYELDAVSRQKFLRGFKKVYSWSSVFDQICDYDVVIHLAGLARDTNNQNDEKAYFDVNHGLTSKIVKWINDAEKPVKLIYLSSIKVYGESSEIDESSEKNPQSVYGRTKLAAENEIIKNLKAYHTYHILEPVMIYGEENKGNLPKLYNFLAKGFPYPFSNWKNNRSILAIQNLSFIISEFIKKDLESDFYIVADDTPISTKEIIEELFDANNKAFVRFYLPKFFIQLLINLSSKMGIKSLEKLLGNLVVSNDKLKRAINTRVLPHSVQSGLQLMGKCLANKK